MPMLPPDSIIGESPIVVDVMNWAMVLGVPLPPTCARPVETKNELITSVARILRFMMRLRFRSRCRDDGSGNQAACDPSSNRQVEHAGHDLKERGALQRAHGANALSRSAPRLWGLACDELASDGGSRMHPQL